MYLKQSPPWLKKIPAREYSINELVEKTGLTYAAIRQRFKALGVEAKKKKVGFGKFSVLMYNWKGWRFYENDKNIKGDNNG